VTEGNEHAIDPAGEARRALHAAVAEYGPEALSNAVIMDRICQDRLSDLPGEAVLIGSAARSDVPAMLRDLIPRLGNYGAIQSVAATLAEAHGLDNAASLWVVREFARAMGLIASGGTQLTERAGPGGSAGQDPGAAPPPRPAEPPGSPTAAVGGAGGRPPGRPSSGARVFNRNTIGIAAAVALVAGYLGVAAAAHLSPFPAKTVAAASSAPASQGNGTSPSPAGSPDPAPDPSPLSDYQILLSKIPSVVQGTDNCANAGTSFGAMAVSQCGRQHGLAAGIIIRYYLYPGPAALRAGFDALLKKERFKKQAPCTSGTDFVDFIAECESAFTSTSPAMTGRIAEYVNTSNQPIIVTSDDQQHVMVVMVGTNDGALLAYWKQRQWVAN
jgi:hypothetical protein